MSVVFRKPHNRLAGRVGNTGLSRAQAVDQAELGIEVLRQPTIDYVDENLQLLRSLIAQADDAASPAYGAVYDASNAIAGTAPLFGLTALGAGAFSLCELLAHLEYQATWNTPVVKIFMNSISLLRRSESHTESNESSLILENLARLLSHVTS